MSRFLATKNVPLFQNISVDIFSWQEMPSLRLANFPTLLSTPLQFPGPRNDRFTNRLEVNECVLSQREPSAESLSTCMQVEHWGCARAILKINRSVRGIKTLPDKRMDNALSEEKTHADFQSICPQRGDTNCS
jgi:hypothetical protein